MPPLQSDLERPLRDLRVRAEDWNALLAAVREIDPEDHLVATVH